MSGARSMLSCLIMTVAACKRVELASAVERSEVRR
ncbi:hypothetical protein predicted by Glimmer/Critica [Sorangium cellulosum So ce56]|uniref:Uncharacterized protein n=1 Tax=Sorangium cellulosum (strain So ce56) TaxID=448385 RepID=A9FAT1_SORC5|nr:hypothetical protein predicted by Glimmer/Critica [Sorangium cellulosum So ce56]